MPELAEVETVRRGLAATVVGRRVTSVGVTGARTVRRTSAQAVVGGLTGRTLGAVGRRGKYLLLQLDSGRMLMIHLRMSGQLVLAAPDVPLAKHTHVVVALDAGQELRFVDPRTFGEVAVIDPARLTEEAPDLASLGPDAFDDVRDVAALRAIVQPRDRMLKYLLTDQRAIAGLGNIYSDEVLHRARLAPSRRSGSLDASDVRRLHRALRGVLAEAIDARGSSLGDAQYVDLWGEGGSYQAAHRVYGRAGQQCGRCGTTLERAAWAGRSTFWCPGCQA